MNTNELDLPPTYLFIAILCAVIIGAFPLIAILDQELQIKELKEKNKILIELKEKNKTLIELNKNC